jgi:hypothetical protein
MSRVEPVGVSRLGERGMRIDLIGVAAMAGGFIVVPTILYTVTRVETWMEGRREAGTPPE